MFWYRYQNDLPFRRVVLVGVCKTESHCFWAFLKCGSPQTVQCDIGVQEVPTVHAA